MLSGTALVLSSAAFVSTAVAIDWPFLRLANEPGKPPCVAENSAACGADATRSGLGGYVRMAQVALQSLVPSLRDDRRLPDGPAGTVEVERIVPKGTAAATAGAAQAHTAAPALRGTQTGGDKHSVEEAEARARELARKLARSLAGEPVR